jgi:hypothetical protein
MKRLLSKSGWLMVWALCAGLSLAAKAGVLYSNNTSPVVPSGGGGNRFNPFNFEVGNEIILANPGWVGVFITNFSFEYWGTASGPIFAGPVQVDVRFYLNDGPSFNGYSTPGTLLWESGLSSINPTEGNNTLGYSGPVSSGGTGTGPFGVWVPTNHFTWTVQFVGQTNADQAGVTLYYPPNVGVYYDGYWLKAVTSWELLYDPSGQIEFGATFEGMPVPYVVGAEPVFQAATLTNGTLSLTWGTVAGGMYQLQYNSDLSSTNWSNLGGAVTAAGTALSATDSVTNGPRRFYRVVLLPSSIGFGLLPSLGPPYMPLSVVPGQPINPSTGVPVPPPGRCCAGP